MGSGTIAPVCTQAILQLVYFLCCQPCGLGYIGCRKIHTFQITGDLRLLEQLLEYTILQGFRTIEQTTEIVEHEHPLVEHRLQLVLRLVELRHFQIEECQLVIKHMIVLDISQLNLVAETVGRILAELWISLNDHGVGSTDHLSRQII